MGNASSLMALPTANADKALSALTATSSTSAWGNTIEGKVQYYLFRDAACAVFGDDAKCVLDPSNYIMHSLNLVNATYDCRCPHPVNGGIHQYQGNLLSTSEFEDCLTLHLAAQASAGTMGTSPPATSEILPNSGVQTGMFPHPTVEMQPNGQNSQFSMFPNTMTGQPGMLPNGETSAQPSSTHPTLGVHFPQTGFPFNPTTMEVRKSCQPKTVLV